MSDNVWVFWSTKDAMNPMQNIKKGHSMRKIVGILVQPLVSYFLQLIYGSVSAGREKSRFRVTFFFTESLRVAKPCKIK